MDNKHAFGDASDINEYTGNFGERVSGFDHNDEIWNQSDYEERLETEAELMVALEAIREALVSLDKDIGDLEFCIENNAEYIEDNYDHINSNDGAIAACDIEIEEQELRLERLQGRCRSS